MNLMSWWTITKNFFAIWSRVAMIADDSVWIMAVVLYFGARSRKFESPLWWCLNLNWTGYKPDTYSSRASIRVALITYFVFVVDVFDIMSQDSWFDQNFSGKLSRETRGRQNQCFRQNTVFYWYVYFHNLKNYLNQTTIYLNVYGPY
jgi:hypothetical protein